MSEEYFAALINKAMDEWEADQEAPDTKTCAQHIALTILAETSPAASPAPAEPTKEMVLAGARSIGNTIHTDDHMVRARECWRAMCDARNGIVEPVPSGIAPPCFDNAEDIAKVATALSQKWPGDYMEGDPPTGPNHLAVETAEVAVAAVSRPHRGDET